MTEREANDRMRDEPSQRCATCDTPYDPGDRFCAQCGAALPEAVQPAPPAPAEPRPEERPAWVLGARPTTVIVGGIALLALAALLLAIGQIDDTGTIVMLSICTAPLGLLTLLIGIARYVAGTARR